MMVSQIKQILSTRGAASLFELTQQLQSDPDVVRDILNIWIRKGCVKLCPKSEDCGSKCAKCNPLFTEVYEWVVDKC